VQSPKQLTEFAIEYMTLQGASAVGVSNTETLAGGPPSTDLEYVLEGARSAVTFALPLDQDKILTYLAKEDHAAHQADNFRTGNAATGLAVALANHWNQHGVPVLRSLIERGLSQRHAAGHDGLPARHLSPLPGGALRGRLVRLLGQHHHRETRRRRPARHDGHDRRARANRAAPGGRQVLRRVPRRTTSTATSASCASPAATPVCLTKKRPPA